jgi:hypothetical protein
MGFELLRDFVTSVLMTGRVKGIDPLSALLIAYPERGKTSIVLERPCKSVVAVSDCTGRGLQEICKHRPEVSHIVLSDMITVLAHRGTVARYTISILNAMTEEGIQAIAFPGSIEVFPNGRRAIIACLTPELVSDHRHWWNKTGFTSRMLPFAFEHSKELQLKIKDALADGKQEHDKNVLALTVPDGRITVEFNQTAKRIIKSLAERKAKEFDEIGYRRIKQYRALAAGHALMRTWKNASIQHDDLQFLKNIEKHVSYTEVTPL